MRRFLLSILFTVAALSMHASDFRYLVLESNDGQLTYVAISGVKIIFENGQLQVQNDTYSATFDSSKVKKFYFAENDADAIEQVFSSEGDSGCAVYDIDGRMVGRYASRELMEKSLPEGLYIIKSKGEIIKKIVK